MDISLATTAAFAIAPLGMIGSLSLTNMLDNAIDLALFDRKYKVDTAPPILALRGRFDQGARGMGYLPTPVRTLRSVLGALPIDHGKFQFIDLGSGKGRTLLVAERFGFKRCVGVEYSAELDRVAGDNIRAYREAVPSGPDMESLCMDAAGFDFPDDPIVLYFYNPFAKDVMQRVAANLMASYERRPRDIYVINFHPRPGNPVTALPFFQRIAPVGANTDIFEVHRVPAAVADPVIPRPSGSAGSACARTWRGRRVAAHRRHRAPRPVQSRPTTPTAWPSLGRYRSAPRRWFWPATPPSPSPLPNRRAQG